MLDEIPQLKACKPVSPALLPATLLFAGCILAFHPGFMSPDSVNQFTEAVNLHFTDWHPPLMAAVWSVFNVICYGPLGMLLLHLLLYWGSLFILADITWRKGNRSWWLWLMIGLLPCTINFVGVIWKDVGLGVSYLAVAASLLRERMQHRKPGVLVLVLLLYGMGIRWNGLLAAPPLLYWWLTLRYPGRSRRLYVLSTLIATFLSVLLIAQINYKILRVEATSPWQIVILHDLAAIGCATGKNLVPSEYKNNGTNESQICAAYDPAWNDPLFAAFANPRPPLHYNSAAASALPKIWLNAVLEHPLAYASHRMAYFAKFLRIGEPKAYFYLYDTVLSNPYGITHHPNALSLVHARYVECFESSFILKPWFWLLMSMGLFVIAVRRGSMPITLVSLSGFVYVIPYWFIGPAPDLRYAYWLILSSAFGLGVLLIPTNTVEIPDQDTLNGIGLGARKATILNSRAA
ncbi:MAG: hypothetical protein ACRER2_01390 [Methylococcales bacterium]